ncbi:hypothetical protein CFIO01_11512 [Colletotrichum fioriniae PJ7]|uniref:Uncharacterized protein n=1 Tax=Colletotrichum fioriniae PJ7 TaxID=1445577 RepID=A0A010QJP6_9PEZI|nr:hypothetical protein CFIO01_11512 [Colletotrichum fioriniae PJ7]
MEKCWFVLRNTHYPPPIGLTEDVAGCTGQLKGLYCCGHIVPDLSHFDDVINTRGPLEIPADMPIFHRRRENPIYKNISGPSTNHSGQISAPIMAAAGITATTSAGIAFQKTVINHAEFEALDSYMMRPTHSYIEDSIATTEVSRYIQRSKRMGSWSCFMITGMIVARGAKVARSETRNIGVQAGLGAGFSGVADVGFNIDHSSENNLTLSSGHVSDFVWAVQVIKIRKGIMDPTWNREIYSKGSTFTDSGAALIEMKDTLRKEGVANKKMIAPGDGSEIFVI